jgi:hypothetical protein
MKFLRTFHLILSGLDSPLLKTLYVVERHSLKSGEITGVDMLTVQNSQAAELLLLCGSLYSVLGTHTDYPLGSVPGFHSWDQYL